MKCLATIIFALSSLVSSAWAHGYIKWVKVNDEQAAEQTGAYFGSGSTDSVVRTITTQDPNYGFDNPALNCGNGAIPVKKLVKANPGDTLILKWVTGDGGRWPHNTGPSEGYMAHCENGDCTTFDSTHAKWFKISDEGIKDGQWPQARYKDSGAPAYVTIPDGISPGQYLLRHEIIALHVWNGKGPEFYPSCIQLEIGGNGSGEAAKGDEVEFPGGYRQDEPGFGDPYNIQGDYKFPGPKIATFVNGGGGDKNGDNDENKPTSTVSDTESSASGSATESSPSATSTSTSCRLKRMKKRAPIINGTSYTSHVAKRVDELDRPRDISRIRRAWQRITTRS